MPLHLIADHEEEIHEVMGGLAEIIVELDGSSWPNARQQCVVWMYDWIRGLDLEHGHLGSKLRALGRTLPVSDVLKKAAGVHFDLQQPLHSC